MKVATEFSGGGVIGYAFKKMGADLVFGVEIDRQKVDLMYAPNHGDLVAVAPVQKVDPAQFGIKPGELDLFQASPPCTKFSRAQKGSEGDLDIAAARAVARHIEYLRPKSIVIENVREYEGSTSCNIVVDELKRLGYDVQSLVLNSADYGTPQTRVRLFIVALRSDIGRVPAIPPTHAEFPQPVLFGQPLKPWTGWLEAVADLISDRPRYLPYWTDLGSLEWRVWEKGETRPAKARENGLADWQVERLKEAIACNKLKGIFEFILDGKNAGRELTTRSGEDPCWTLVASSDSEAHWPRAFIPSDRDLSSTPIRAVLVPGANAGNNTPTVRMDDRPGVTLTPGTYPRGLFCKNLDLRNASVDRKLKALIDNCCIVKFDARMLARIQGLGDDYKLCANNGVASSCIGNGVAVQVAQAIYRAIEKVIYPQR